MTGGSNENNLHDVGVAMGLVCAAAASTGLGAAVVFFPQLVKMASRRVLAGSLGFAAGVMTYISFVDIFQKSLRAFEDAGHDEGISTLYSTLSFFGGVFLMMVLNIIVGKLLGAHSHGPPTEKGHDHDHDHDHGKTSKKSKQKVSERKMDDDALAPKCCSSDPVGRLNTWKKMADGLDEDQDPVEDDDFLDNPEEMDMELDIEDDFVENLPLEDRDSDPGDGSVEGDDKKAQEKDTKTEVENKRLVSMGINTAVAIGLHNFPEGLSTFVAALNDPEVGGVLAFAIAIHNIPEGLCVALPIYYATGKRLNAFLWALLSGASEVVAALLGWAILANLVSQNTYGVLFGMVAGMMVIISIRELLPTAHFYDPEDTVVTNSFVGGMALLGLSLVLFKI